MREDLSNFLREINAILAAFHKSAGNTATIRANSMRIQELVLTWSVNLMPGLAAIGVPWEVLNLSDQVTLKLARLVSRSPSRKKIIAAVKAVQKVLIERVLPEISRIPQLRKAKFIAPAPASIFPEIPDLPNQLVPYALQGWSAQIKHFLEQNPFGKNVFIMVAYRANLETLIDGAKKTLLALELNPIVAKDHRITDDLYNPIACLLCCSFGVAIFDRAEVLQMHNPNVVYELGMMQLLKRPCIILKHSKLRKMPSDLLAKLYEAYSTKADAMRCLRSWWKKTSAQ